MLLVNAIPKKLDMKLTLRDFDYQLPPELIAQHPVTPRDNARLLILKHGLSPDTAHITHDHFYNLGQWLQPGDVLIINDSKVIPARLHGTKPSGGKIEIFLLWPTTDLLWSCLVRGKVKPGLTLTLTDGFTGTLQRPLDEMAWEIKFNKPNITSIGSVPLPPYITAANPMSEYQTVYAQADGSVAAPTAGLHFTNALLTQLKAADIIIAPITLHVGLGTFAPVKTEQLANHVMHKEYAILPEATARIISAAKKRGNKIVAVGTTACRTLEAFAGKTNQGWVDIFITPGYHFNTVDALITNFHLPKSTLLMLVSALAGKAAIDRAYAVAITERYRFFSFGDAMLIL